MGNRRINKTDLAGEDWGNDKTIPWLFELFRVDTKTVLPVMMAAWYNVNTLGLI